MEWREKLKQYWPYLIVAVFLLWWYLRSRASAASDPNAGIYPNPLDYGAVQAAAQRALDTAAAFPGAPQISIGPGTGAGMAGCTDPCQSSNGGLVTGGVWNPNSGYCEKPGTGMFSAVPQRSAPICCPSGYSFSLAGGNCVPTTTGTTTTPPTSGVGNGNNPVSPPTSSNPAPPVITIGGGNPAPAPTPAPPAPAPPPGGGVGGPILPGGPTGPPIVGGSGACAIPGESRNSAGVCICAPPKSLKFTGKGWLCS